MNTQRTLNPVSENPVTSSRPIYSYEQAKAASTEYFNGDELAAAVFVDKYALRNEKNELVELTPTDMHWRIANEFARIEQRKFKDPMSAQTIFNLLDRFAKVVMQGSPSYGIGNYYQYISIGNCFVIPSPLDSYLGIMHTDTQITQISCRRGGVGWSNSKLRPAGMLVKNAAKTTSGMIGFAKRFSNTVREVGQHGRRGASLQELSCWHPEIMEFIKVKQNLTELTGSNISVDFYDDFMQKVFDRADIKLRWPVCKADADEMKRPFPECEVAANAGQIWDEFIKSAHLMAEPGCKFMDTVHRMSPGVPYGHIETASNPCVTADTWVMTSEGPRRVSDLIGKKFNALVGNQSYESTVDGFWCSGVKQTIKLKTLGGFTIECTPDHKLLSARIENGVKVTEWKEAQNFTTSDMVDVNNHTGVEWDGQGTDDEGYLIGTILGDGHITDNKTARVSWWGENKGEMKDYTRDLVHRTLDCKSNLGSGSVVCKSAVDRDSTGFSSVRLLELTQTFDLHHDKKITDTIEKASSDFYRGFLRGWFDSDGTVQINQSNGSYSVRLSCSTLPNLEVAHRMLARLGIVSKLYVNRRESGYRSMPDGRGGSKEYPCQANHEIVITKSNIRAFRDSIGFIDSSKAEKLNRVCDQFALSAETYTSRVISIENGSTQPVYDCTVDKVHRFDANGITIKNCGEQNMPPYASCRLLLLNLISYVRNKFKPDAYFDFEAFAADVKILQRLGDDLVDIEIECIDRILDKLSRDPEPDYIKKPAVDLWENVRRVALLDRRTGCGFTALGDTIAALNMKYGSKLSIEFAEKMQRIYALSAYRSSVEMAKELGHFPEFDAKLDIQSGFIQLIQKEDPELFSDMQKWGRRNMVLLTVAPVGSLSCETQTTSGMEPVFLLYYTRRKKGNPGDSGFRTDSIDANGDHWMHFDVYHKGLQDWMDITGNKNIKDSPYYGASANDIDWLSRVTMQATLQKWIDNSISSTVNLPQDVPVETVDKIYKTAWKMGCKGITIYRDKCRDGVLVSKEPEKKLSGKEQALADRLWHEYLETKPVKRPKELACDIHHTKSKGEDFFVLVGLMDNHPYEVFAGKNGTVTSAKTGTITKNKRGHYELKASDDSVIENVCDLLTDEQAVITRMVSLSLRHGSNVSFIVDQLEKAPGDMTNFGKALARTLKKYIKNGSKVTGATCTNCGSSDIVRQEGCQTCSGCGSSKCS